MHAFVLDVAATWPRYLELVATLPSAGLPGLIVQVAGPTDAGFRIISLWETGRGWQRYRAEHLGPAIATVDGRAQPEPVLRALSVGHVIRGPSLATLQPPRGRAAVAVGPGRRREVAQTPHDPSATDRGRLAPVNDVRGPRTR